MGVARDASIRASNSRRAHSDERPVTCTSAAAPRNLLEAIELRSPNRIIQELQNLQMNGQSATLDEVHIESVMRALRPYDFFSKPRSRETYRLYRRRMIFLRKWLSHSGTKMTKALYFLLLEEARLDMLHDPNSPLAQETWTALIDSGIDPDIKCYNSFIAATCVQPSSFDRLRLRRRNDKQPEHRQLQRSNAELVLQRSIMLYRDLLKKKMEPNAMTMELLLLSLAWCGNIQGIKSLILRTWNLSLPDPDFEALEEQGVLDEYDDEDLDLMESATRSNVDVPGMSHESPVFPTQHTLTVLAIALGANQQNSMALHAVQKMAEVYGLTISTKVWSELMKWAVLDSELLHGYTSKTHPDMLFEKSCELGTRPSLSMFNYAIRNSLLGDRDPARAFGLMSDMLSAVEGQTHLNRPIFHAKKLYPHARAIALKYLLKVQKSTTSRLHQLGRKLGRAKEEGGIDAIRLLEQDIQRREKHALQLISRWADRINEFDRLTTGLLRGDYVAQ